jgi:DNA-binding NarL/FixJ family response regulator
MQLLIVDSSIHIAERLGDILSGTAGIRVIHRAAGYEEAKTLFREHRHDTILLDMDLRGTAIQLIKEIKNVCRQTRIIMLFTYTDIYIKMQCRSLGVDFFFDKYYDFEKIGNFLGSSSFAGTGNKKVQIEKQLPR